MFGGTTVGPAHVNLQNRANYEAPSTLKSIIPPTKSLPPVPPPKPATIPTTITKQVTPATANTPNIQSQQKANAVAAPKLQSTTPTNAKIEESKAQAKSQQDVTVQSLVQALPQLSVSADSSEEQLKKAVEKDPLNEQAVVALSKYYESKKMMKEAIIVFDQAVKEAIKAQNLTLRVTFGDYYADLLCLTGVPSYLNGAAHCYEKSAQLFPDKRPFYQAKIIAACKKRDEILAAAKK